MRSLVRHLVVTAALVAACGSKESTDDRGAVMVGVQSPELGSVVSGFHIVVKNGSTVVKDETVPSLTNGELIAVNGLPGTTVDASVEALAAAGGAPIITRLASTTIPGAGANPKLLRLRLETSCAVLNGVGPSCVAPQTCIGGTCQASFAQPTDLEDFTQGWASEPPPDACRPLKPGAPELQLGTGQTDYSPLTDGQTLMLEQGPQGGHHVWIALRMKNLRQEGSTSTITSTVEGDPTPIAPLSVVFAFTPDEGNYCKEFGLRYQVDASTLGADGTPQDGRDYHFFLGKRLDVVATVTDSTGGSATDKRTIQIAEKIVCADGTDACNQ